MSRTAILCFYVFAFVTLITTSAFANALKNTRALIVDDNPTLLETYEREFVGWGVAIVDKAASAEQALEMSAQHTYDFIVTEYYLTVTIDGKTVPTMSGAELAAQLRARDVNVPLFLQTGDAPKLTSEQKAYFMALLPKGGMSENVKLQVQDGLKRFKAANEIKTMHLETETPKDACEQQVSS